MVKNIIQITDVQIRIPSVILAKPYIMLMPMTPVLKKICIVFAKLVLYITMREHVQMQICISNVHLAAISIDIPLIVQNVLLIVEEHVHLAPVRCQGFLLNVQFAIHKKLIYSFYIRTTLYNPFKLIFIL